MSEQWERVGRCGVDAGLIIIGDPCYFAVPDADHHPAKTWDEFCDRCVPAENEISKQLCFERGYDGLGVVISGFGGDGIYPVFVRRNEEGMVVEAKIAFEEQSP